MKLPSLYHTGLELPKGVGVTSQASQPAWSISFLSMARLSGPITATSWLPRFIGKPVAPKCLFLRELKISMSVVSGISSTFSRTTRLRESRCHYSDRAAAAQRGVFYESLVILSSQILPSVHLVEAPPRFHSSHLCRCHSLPSSAAGLYSALSSRMRT